MGWWAYEENVGVEWSGSLDRYPIDCYEYLSPCGAKKIANISTYSILAVWHQPIVKIDVEDWKTAKKEKTRSSWFNCALRDDEAVYWVSIGQFEAVAVGDWWYWVSRGHACLYILHKVEIWTGVTDALRTDSLTTLKDRATQLLINKA